MKHTVTTALFDLLVTRDFKPEILDSSGKNVADPADAELFSFDWVNDGRNYGTVVVLFGQDNDIEVYYGDSLGRGMETDDKTAWYDFLAQLKTFATRNLKTFNLNNINRLKYTMQGMAAIKEGLFEGFYGSKNLSYSDQPKHTRLMIKHNRSLGVGEARHRAIETLFVETAAGERFRVPSRSLMHGRMLARHVAEGGTPYDAFGQYITEMVNELKILGRFLRASRDRDLIEQAAVLTAEATRHYHDLGAKARSMISQRGYLEARNSFDPGTVPGTKHTIDSIREMFVEQNIDSRIEEALSVLARLQAPIMKEADEFEVWADHMVEGTWALPTGPEALARLKKLMANPLQVGPDASNATEQLYDLLGDNELFDQLGELARIDADSDARPMVLDRLKQLGMANILDTNQSVTDADMQEDLDVDGVMMTRPSNMSSESRDFDLERLRRLALLS